MLFKNILLSNCKMPNRRRPRNPRPPLISQENIIVNGMPVGSPVLIRENAFVIGR